MTIQPDSDAKYRVIGSRPIRPDGVEKVTGRAIFTADVRAADALYGRVLRSPHAHAVIRGIDASKALALDGVEAVVTAADLPPLPSDAPENIRIIAGRVLATDKALFHGHAVAAVAARDPHVAEDALELIEVDYELLEPVLDVREAMSDSAPIVHEELRTDVFGAGADVAEAGPTNVAAHVRVDRGDTEAAFAEADLVIEREFRTGTFHQGYIEPHASTAEWRPNGEVTIWTSTQGLFINREQTAALLGLPVSRVQVIPTEIGGGFGGKGMGGLYLEPLAAALSRKTGQTVKMAMPRAEVLMATGPTSASYSRVRIGAKRDGTLVAGEAWLAYEAGAFPGSPMRGGVRCAFASYDIPNLHIDGFDVVTNKPKAAAYRAPGAPAAALAVESVINELAEELELDPLELRLKNAAVEGDSGPTGPFARIGAREVIETMQNHPHYTSELHGEDVGRGVAIGYWSNVGGDASANAAVNGDGTVNLILGAMDLSGTRAALAMQLAEALGIEGDRVRPRVVDTDSVGYTAGSGGSRITFAVGWAVYELAAELRKRLEERAARIWEVDRADAAYGDDGVVRGPKDEAGEPRQLTFGELAAQLISTGGMVAASATVQPTTPGPAFAGHIVDVHVDRETGKVEVLRYTAVQDVGTAIHPDYVEGQIQGGAAQGIGMALNEDYVYDEEGHLLNSSLLDYRMPTTLDVPMIEAVLVEVPNPGHPFGVRGVGEAPIIPPQAAVRQAIADAVGARMQQTPMTPQAVLQELMGEEAD